MELLWNFPCSKMSKMEAKREVKPESLKYLRSVPLSGEMLFYSKPYAKLESIRQKRALRQAQRFCYREESRCPRADADRVFPYIQGK